MKASGRVSGESGSNPISWSRNFTTVPSLGRALAVPPMLSSGSSGWVKCRRNGPA
jgi:hypothetical protein